MTGSAPVDVASGPAPTGAAPPQDAVIFDMDGVVTDTAGVHARAWQRLFDEVLTDPRAAGDTGKQAPFDITVDYRRYVDGARPGHNMHHWSRPDVGWCDKSSIACREV